MLSGSNVSSLSLFSFLLFLFVPPAFLPSQQEVLCCGNLPSWNPSIFGGSTHPVGLIDEQSGAATPDFLELQEALPTVRRGTWDICHVDRGKKREEEGIVRVEGDEDVEYQERRRTNVGDELEEVRERLKVIIYPCTNVNSLRSIRQHKSPKAVIFELP